ncbi:MAG TPA: polysaccharide pyruvyl transferase family protein [Streptomyces sp.]|uniref:polysaccharide pyruvyl transferase family protein n=1 Tax=Streptomyces sp. TaxID=1931 RepID=UPI002C2DAEE7|nr:polysaccharide pyruvyl transferase family protein [Streptomyces sp.]HWU08731.1 polysaccharide pyruvyl transferase family protein [Streptomyces sp.]
MNSPADPTAGRRTESVAGRGQAGPATGREHADPAAAPGSSASPGPSAAPGRLDADDRRAVTGKRRIAFAAYADEDRMPGLLVLLRSLALTGPAVCEDFLLLHPGLPDSAFDAARRLHPRLVPRTADSRLDAFRATGYDTVVVLGPGMVVLRPLAPLLALRTGVAAVPQPGSGGGRTVRDDGLLVIQRQDVTDAVLDALAEGGADVVHRALTEAGLLEPLGSPYDFPAGRLYDDAPVPASTVVLHFREDHFGKEHGEEGRFGEEDRFGEDPAPSAPAREARERYAMDDEAFRAAYCALPGPKHPELLLHCALPFPEGRRAPVDLVRQVAEVLRQQGRYDEAVALLSAAVADRPDLPRCHETLGISLMALSRYEEAEAHLLLATVSPDFAARAYGQLARLAWLLGRDTDAHAYAREGLDADPTDGNCHAWYVRTRPGPGAVPASGPAPAGEQLAHVALFADGQENAGDKVLPEAVRMCFGPDTGPARWHERSVHRLVDEPALEELNARRGIVVGGGGLFLPDTAPNSNSGWQWNIPDDVLARITAPLAVFAVGYNVFDGQRYRRERFAASLRALVGQSSFFGLRNQGSVDRVRELLPQELRDRVRYQPCPTTVARHLDPGLDGGLDGGAGRDDTVLVNCAYDRAGLRFGHDYGHFLAETAAAVRAIGERAEVRYAAHMPADEKFVHDLRREHGIALPVEPLYLFGNDRIRELYRRTRLVIGMRGHAGMIPFGCGTPIISLVSHPKLAYFLSDIGRPDWGVSVHDRSLGARLAERAADVLDDHRAAVADVHGRQEHLWSVTRANLAGLQELFGLPDPLPAGPRAPGPRTAGPARGLHLPDTRTK